MPHVRRDHPQATAARAGARAVKRRPSASSFSVMPVYGRVVGVLTRADLLRGSSEKGGDASVAAAMTPRFETVQSSEMLDGAFQRLQSSACPALPVLQGEQLVGVLTPDNVGEFLAIRSALHADGQGDGYGTRRRQ